MGAGDVSEADAAIVMTGLGRDSMGGLAMRGLTVAWLTLGVLFVCGSCVSYAPAIELVAEIAVTVAFWLFVILSLMLTGFLLRRGTRRAAAGGCLVVPVVFAAFVFAGFVACCVPRATRIAPDEEWIQSVILSSVPVARTNLVFIGGVSSREPIRYFAVKGELPELVGFSREAGFRGRSIESLRHGARRFGIPFEAADDGEVLTKFVRTARSIGTLTVVKDAAGATVVYQSM